MTLHGFKKHLSNRMQDENYIKVEPLDEKVSSCEEAYDRILGPPDNNGSYPEDNELCSENEKPKIPKELEEAAERFAYIGIKDKDRHLFTPLCETVKRAFLAGAAFTMGLGVMLDGVITVIGDNRWLDLDDEQQKSKLKDFKDDEEVFVHVLKKK